MSAMQLTPLHIDRAAGSLVGLACGDGLGAGYEFGPPLTETPVMKDGGRFGWEPGEWTDDTSMAICIAQVTSTGSVDTIAIVGRFLDWFHSNPKDVGILTRAVLSASHTPADVAVRSATHYQQHPNSSAGNGSLMRTGPIALACLGNDTKLAATAREVSDLTHGDPMAGDACVLWCVAIDRAIRHGKLDGIRDGLQLLPPERRATWAALIDEAESKPPRAFSLNGYVVKALQAAHSSIFHTNIPEDMPCLHFQHALQRAVQIGDDADTVGAIAGALLGARWGLSAIPARWVTALHGWPGVRVGDLVRLAVLSARNGESDSSGWPAAANLCD